MRRTALPLEAASQCTSRLFFPVTPGQSIGLSWEPEKTPFS